MNDVVIHEICGRHICIKGIGKMFYQDGFPISMAISELKKKGVEVSILHVADECLKNGWSAKTTINKLRSEAADAIDTDSSFDMGAVEKFCHSCYEEQREMLFQYLFGCSTNEVREGKNTEPLNWLRG